MRILLASDGSPSSLRAAAYVSELVAGLPGAAVIVVTIVKPDADRSVAEAVLLKTTETMRPVPPVLRTMVLTGEPASAICDYAVQIKANFVVVGTRGQSLKRLMLGSVSESTIALAACPVMVVK